MGQAVKMSLGVTTFLNPYLSSPTLLSTVANSVSKRDGLTSYFSATCLHLSPSPPVTRTHLSRRGWWSIPLSTSSANGVWLCTKSPVSSGSCRLLLRSATLSVSCLPPPLVRSMNGIRWDWRYPSAFRARGRGLELRRRTPSILRRLSNCQL